MKKILSFMLAVMMVLSISVGVVAADKVVLTFKDAAGTTVGTLEVETGSAVPEDAELPATPTLAGDGVITNTFVGWSIDGENVIDLYVTAFNEDTALTPIFTQYGVYFDADPVVLPKVSSEVVVGEDGTETTVVTMTYADGTTSGLTPIELLPEPVQLDPNASGYTIVYKVEGADTEIIADNAWALRSTATTPAWQWDDAPFCTDLVYETGEEGAFDFAPNHLTLGNGYFFIYINDSINGMNSQTSPANTMVGSYQLFQAYNANSSNNGRAPENANENASVQFLALIQDNAQPVVTFHDADGKELTTYQYKYTDVWMNVGYDTTKTAYLSCVRGRLLSADEIFAAAQDASSVTDEEGNVTVVLEAPTKKSDSDKAVYEFDGWVDAEGNPVDAVYSNVDVYPSFKEIDLRTQYKVTFKNYDDTVLYETVIREGETPVYPDATLGTPKKPSTETNSYLFDGWADADGNGIVAGPATDDYTGAVSDTEYVYIAKYKETERRYDVTFYDEDGETWLGESLSIVKGGAATAPADPTKEADDVYTYAFEKWVDMDGKDVDLKNINADLSVKAKYTATLRNCTVTFYYDDGETVIGTDEVEYGGAATAPDSAKDPSEFFVYTFVKWVDAEGNDADFSKVTADMSVYAVYEATFHTAYDDVNAMDGTEWYAEAIQYVLVNGVMNGMSATNFDFDTNMSRAMVVTVLYRYLGEPTVYTPVGYEEFVDNTDESTWYYSAVVWAKVNGVVNGKPGNKFDPDGDVTREEFASILYRFSDEVQGEYMGSGRSSLSAFADKNEISDWAQNAVKWAYATAEDMNLTGFTAYDKTQYINGTGVDAATGKAYFSPKAYATRAQVATMLYRYMTGVRVKA